MSRDELDDADVASVVGAGPAGSAAALAVLAARPAARVALLDRADFPRDKSCGDGVAPQVLDVLDRLGVRGLLDDWPTDRRARARLPGRRLAAAGRWPARTASCRGGARRAARRRRRRARSGAAARAGEDLVRDGGPLVAGGVRARVVVGADGAHPQVRASLRPPGGGRTAIALRGYAPVSPGREQRRSSRSTRAAPGRRTRGRSRSATAERQRRLRGTCRPTGRPRRGPISWSGSTRCCPGQGTAPPDWRGHHLPLSTGRWHQPDGPVLLAGDALGLVNPLTGEGIHAAVLSGALAGLAAAAALREGAPDSAGARYRAALRARFGRHQRHMSLLSRAVRLTAPPRPVPAARDPRRHGTAADVPGWSRPRSPWPLPAAISASSTTSPSWVSPRAR